MIVLVNGHPEARRIERVAAGEVDPRRLDRFRLEVVAEGEFPSHLEEVTVAGGVTHVCRGVALSLSIAGVIALLSPSAARV
jgi:hypothetical protein